MPRTMRADSGRPLSLSHQEPALRHGDHVIGLGVQDVIVSGLTGPGPVPPPPCRARESPRRRPRIEIHRHGTAPGGADEHLGMVPFVLRLGCAARSSRGGRPTGAGVERPFDLNFSCRLEYTRRMAFGM